MQYIDRNLQNKERLQIYTKSRKKNIMSLAIQESTWDQIVFSLINYLPWTIIFGNFIQSFCIPMYTLRWFR